MREKEQQLEVFLFFDSLLLPWDTRMITRERERVILQTEQHETDQERTRGGVERERRSRRLKRPSERGRYLFDAASLPLSLFLVSIVPLDFIVVQRRLFPPSLFSFTARGERTQESLVSLPPTSGTRANGTVARESKRAPIQRRLAAVLFSLLRKAATRRSDTRLLIHHRGRVFPPDVRRSCPSLSLRDSPRARNLSLGTRKKPGRA